MNLSKKGDVLARIAKLKKGQESSCSHSDWLQELRYHPGSPHFFLFTFHLCFFLCVGFNLLSCGHHISSTALSSPELYSYDLTT